MNVKSNVNLRTEIIFITFSTRDPGFPPRRKALTRPLIHAPRSPYLACPPFASFARESLETRAQVHEQDPIVLGHLGSATQGREAARYTRGDKNSLGTSQGACRRRRCRGRVALGLGGLARGRYRRYVYRELSLHHAPRRIPAYPQNTYSKSFN